MLTAAESRAAFDAIPDGAYDVILCDPPWNYDDNRRHVARPTYPTMSMADLRALDVRRIARRPVDGGALLFMWTTGPMMGDAIALAASWGFTFRTVFFVWIKRGSRGADVTLAGAYTLSSTEFLLVCVRGKRVCASMRHSRCVRQIVRAQRHGHSVKPSKAMRRLEAWLGIGAASVTPQPRCLEMFARRRRRGWHAWGNEVPDAATDANTCERPPPVVVVPLGAPVSTA